MKLSEKSLEDRLRELRALANQRTNAAAVAQARADQAQERLSEARRRLKEEFGVSSPEEARLLAAGLESELAAAMGEVESYLGEK